MVTRSPWECPACSGSAPSRCRWPSWSTWPSSSGLSSTSRQGKMFSAPSDAHLSCNCERPCRFRPQGCQMPGAVWGCRQCCVFPGSPTVRRSAASRMDYPAPATRRHRPDVVPAGMTSCGTGRHRFLLGSVHQCSSYASVCWVKAKVRDTII